MIKIGIYAFFAKICLLLPLLGYAAGKKELLEITPDEKALLRECFLHKGSNQVKSVDGLTLKELAGAHLNAALKLVDAEISREVWITPYELNIPSDRIFQHKCLVVTTNSRTTHWDLSSAKDETLYALADKLVLCPDPCAKALLIAIYSNLGVRISGSRVDGYTEYSVDELRASLQRLEVEDRKSPPRFHPIERAVLCGLCVAATAGLSVALYNAALLFGS